MTEANSSFISLVSVVGSPENKDFFWDTLAPCDQAAFRLCCREARDLANDLVDTLLLQLPCFEYQNHDIRSLPTAEQLAALHTGALRHAGALRVSYKHPDQGPIRLGRAALYMGQYLAAAVALPSVRMCKVSLAAEDRLQIAVAAMLACLLPNLELQFITMVTYDANEPPSSLLQAFKRCPHLHTVCCNMVHGSEPMLAVIDAAVAALPRLSALGWSMVLELQRLPQLIRRLPDLRTLGVSSIEHINDEAAGAEALIAPDANPLCLALCRQGWLAYQPGWSPDGRLPVTHHVLRRLPCVSRVSGGMLIARTFPSVSDLSEAVGRLSSLSRAYALQFKLACDDAPPSPDVRPPWWQRLNAGCLHDVCNAHVHVTPSPTTYTDVAGLLEWPRRVLESIAKALPDLQGLSLSSAGPECVTNMAAVMLPLLPQVTRVWLTWPRDPKDFSPKGVSALTGALMAAATAASPRAGAQRWIIAMGIPQVVADTCNRLLAVQVPAISVRVGTDYYSTPYEPAEPADA